MPPGAWSLEKVAAVLEQFSRDEHAKLFFATVQDIRPHHQSHLGQAIHDSTQLSLRAHDEL